MYRRLRRTCSAVSALAIGGLAAIAHSGTGPVLTGSYDWEDGQGTILGSFNELSDPLNVTHPEPVNSGDHALRFTRDIGVPQAYVAYIEHLQDGDSVTVSMFLYDDGVTTGRSRIWGHYAQSGDVNSYAGSADGNDQYTAGIGWQELTHTFEFNSQGGTRDALVIEVRGYAQSGGSDDPKTAPTFHYVDDIYVEVYCASNPDLTISFPGDVAFVGPTEPGPECKLPKPCKPQPLGDYGWEDGKATAFNTTGNISLIENVTDFDGVFPYSGNHMLRARQGNPSGTPQVWVAFIENLTDGDEIYASFAGYDPSPGSPRMRLWAHRGVSGNPSAVAGQFGGEFQTYTSGIGWEEVEEKWIFDSNNGQADALMIQVRLYAASGEEDTDFLFDDISIEVCAANPNVAVTFPDGLDPPVDSCDPPSFSPSLQGTFGWEDGKSTILGQFIPGGGDNIATANVGEPEPVNSGDRALRITEAPHGGSTPQVYVAFVEGLNVGDVIHARFHAFDDQPGGNPQVRIWGKNAFSGDVNSFDGSAGGNSDATIGIGWEEICHTWTFTGGNSGNADALAIEVRVYSTPSTCEECSTDYYIDDLYVGVWGNSNASITFPDGSVIGEPPLICPADITGSGSVDIFDLFALLGAWGTADADADVNNDGTVDGADLGILLASWGECQQPYLRPAADDIELVVVSTDAGGGATQHNIYVQLEAADALVNVFDANINFSGGLQPSSFIAIGQESFSVVEDPNFDPFAFMSGTGVGTDGGWYNDNPTNNLGLAGSYANNQVLIASFTMLNGENADGTLSVTYNDADGRPIYGTASFDTASVSTCVGDLNGDGVVNVSDLLILLGAWGSCAGCDADFNNDGVVNVSDMLILLGAWGSCP